MSIEELIKQLSEEVNSGRISKDAEVMFEYKYYDEMMGEEIVEEEVDNIELRWSKWNECNYVMLKKFL